MASQATTGVSLGGYRYDPNAPIMQQYGNGAPAATKPAGAVPTASTGMTGSNSAIPQPTINNQFPQSVIGANNDYADLMAQYKKLLPDAGVNTSLASQYQDQYNRPTAAFQPVTPQTASYNPTADTTASIGNLKQLSETGGYSAEDISNLRSRAVAPVRSVYSSAQQGINRAKRLQGGYSPNFTAATAKLTRGESDAATDALINANAGIAQNVASNKLGIAPAYASASQNQQSDINNTDKFNAETTNDASKFNSSGQSQASQFDAQSKQQTLQSLAALYTSGTSNKLAILEAMRQLYGTTPAQPALYGQQAATQTGLDLQNKQINNNASSALINSYRS